MVKLNKLQFCFNSLNIVMYSDIFINESIKWPIVYNILKFNDPDQDQFSSYSMPNYEFNQVIL